MEIDVTSNVRRSLTLLDCIILYHIIYMYRCPTIVKLILYHIYIYGGGS